MRLVDPQGLLPAGPVLAALLVSEKLENSFRKRSSGVFLTSATCLPIKDTRVSCSIELRRTRAGTSRPSPHQGISLPRNGNGSPLSSMARWRHDPYARSRF